MNTLLFISTTIAGAATLYACPPLDRITNGTNGSCSSFSLMVSAIMQNDMGLKLSSGNTASSHSRNP